MLVIRIALAREGTASPTFIAGVLCAAAMLSTAGLVLSEKMDVLQLTFYTAPVSCAMLFPMYLLREVSTLILHGDQAVKLHCPEPGKRGKRANESIAACFLAGMQDLPDDFLLRQPSSSKFIPKT